MSLPGLTYADTWAVINALNVAAEVYTADARNFELSGDTRSAEGFRNQAANARRIADALEQAAP